MRRTPVVVACAAIAATALTTTSAQASAAPATRTDRPANAWQCRTGTTSPSPRLTATGTVCSRYAQGSWQGKGSVRLVATGAPVTGMLTQGADHYPSDESAWFATPFTVRPGHPVTLPLAGRDKASAKDSAGGWTANVGISVDGQPDRLPTGPDGVSEDLEGRLHSPLVRRTSAGSTGSPSAFRGHGPNTCSSSHVRTGGPTGFVGTVGLCLRQDGGQVYADVPHVVYTAAAGVPVSVTLLIDGRPATATLQVLDASPTARTDTALPSTRAQVLRGEHTAVVRLEANGRTVSSPTIRLRG